jgi:hypothetical protein
MAEIKKTTTEKKTIAKEGRKPAAEMTSLFTKDNFMWMAIGAVLIAIGMFLMAGGKSENPSVFDKEAVYSSTRLTVAPILIVLGLIVEVYAIFKKPAVTR